MRANAVMGNATPRAVQKCVTNDVCIYVRVNSIQQLDTINAYAPSNSSENTYTYNPIHLHEAIVPEGILVYLLLVRQIQMSHASRAKAVTYTKYSHMTLHTYMVIWS